VAKQTLDLRQYDCLGAALHDALDRWAQHVCLIEADRDREKARLTYAQFKKAALPLAAALQSRKFAAGDRAAIVMTNQSKWLISAYAITFAGGVLVPLDYKLTAAEHLALLEHSKATVLVVEFPMFRAILQTDSAAAQRIGTVLVTEAPPNAELGGALRWEAFQTSAKNEAVFVPRKRTDVASIVYSSGTGGRPKGCVATHEAYLEQCQAIGSVIVFEPGVRYLSILPTNHVVDFMMGFMLPFITGATVVHLRTLRPEYIRDAFTRYKISYMMVVPLVLKNLQKGLQEKFAALPRGKRAALNAMIALNRTLSGGKPRPWLARRLLGQVHAGFGGEFRAFGVGSAFIEPATLKFFFDLGIPVANSYGLTEAGTAVTVNDPRAPRADTVGKPLPGAELRIANPAADGIGEVAVRSKTMMSHYLDDPALTADAIVDGWLMTGDLGRLDATGHLQLFGRKKNMIVTAEGKNVYPEDIENAFDALPVKEFCVFAANYVWPRRSMLGEQLIILLRPEPGNSVDDALRSQINACNQKLLNFKRVSGYVVWDRDFPRTASTKVKRAELAQQLSKLDRSAAVVNL
jgi:long-chain acyl-CoA synthetase